MKKIPKIYEIFNHKCVSCTIPEYIINDSEVCSYIYYFKEKITGANIVKEKDGKSIVDQLRIQYFVTSGNHFCQEKIYMPIMQ